MEKDLTDLLDFPWRETSIVLVDKIEIVFNPTNKYHYIEKGYNYTTRGETCIVDVEDLSHGTVTRVPVRCPVCEEERTLEYSKVVAQGHTTCVSCASTLSKIKDLRGQKFGRLSPLRVVGKKPNGVIWLCQCDCGNYMEKHSNNLLWGDGVKSCGCYMKEFIRENMSGSAHHWWNPNKERGKKVVKLTKRKEYRWWRLDVLCRDNERCIICGSGDNVRVHHIYNKYHYPQFMHNLSNGICLCREHHREFHYSFIGSCHDPCTPLDLMRFMLHKGIGEEALSNIWLEKDLVK